MFKYLVSFNGEKRLVAVLNKADLKRACTESFGVDEGIVVIEAFVEEFNEFATVPLHLMPDTGRIRLRVDVDVGASICSASTVPVTSDSDVMSLLASPLVDTSDDENSGVRQNAGDGARGVEASAPSTSQVQADTGDHPATEAKEAKEAKKSGPEMEGDESYPQTTGYQVMVEALFGIFPQLGGKGSAEEIVKQKSAFRKKLRTKFKNGRRAATDNDKLNEEKEKMGIQPRGSEGMSNFMPEFKKPRIDVNVMSAQLISILSKATDDEQLKRALKESFALRRQLVASPKTRLSIEQLKALYPQWCTEKAVWWDIETIVGEDRNKIYEDKMKKLASQICALTDCEIEHSARNLCLLAGECCTDLLESPAPQPTGLFIMRDKVWLGNTVLIEVSEREEWRRLLLLAAVHAVFYLKLGGVGRHTLTLIYAKVLGFKVPLTSLGNQVWKKLGNAC